MVVALFELILRFHQIFEGAHQKWLFSRRCSSYLWQGGGEHLQRFQRQPSVQPSLTDFNLSSSLARRTVAQVRPASLASLYRQKHSNSDA
jgi:hypothetical protein